MIITGAIFASAAAIHYTTAFVFWAIAGTAVVVGAGVGVTVYLLVKSPLSPEDMVALVKLHQEAELLEKKLQEDTGKLVTNTADYIEKIAATTDEIHEHINDSTKLLDIEAQFAKGANLQLEEIVALLQQVSHSTSHKAETLIVEIQGRLDELSKTNQELKTACGSLTKTAALLEASVVGYADTQKYLEGTIKTEGLKIKGLTDELLEAKKKMAHDDKDLNIKEMALICAEKENQKLLATISELELQRTPLLEKLKSVADAREAQAVKMHDVLLANHKLSQKIRELGLKLEEKDLKASLSSSASTHALTLFGRQV